jgi:hypothetical protein
VPDISVDPPNLLSVELETRVPQPYSIVISPWAELTGYCVLEGIPVTVNHPRICVALLMGTVWGLPGAVWCEALQPRLNEIVTANITGPPDEYEADTSNCPVQDCEQWYMDLGPEVYDGDYPDWIEIHNPWDEILNLEGYGLSDNPARPFKWVFPSVTIEPGGYLVVFASGKDKVEQNVHTNFQLSREGETVVLTAPSGALCDEIFTGGIPIDMSMGRRADSVSDWVWYDLPTPGAINDTEPFPGFTGQVIAEPSAGVYPSALQVVLLTTSPDAEIRFTRDGSEPDAGAELFASSVEIRETVVLRAQGFRLGRKTTPMVTHTYLIGETSTLPVVSLSTDPEHLWDPDLGIYTAGRNARESERVANYWQDWERPVHVEFFETNGHRAFNLDAGIQIFGWGSRSNPQKSLAIALRNRYGAPELDYPLFPGMPVRRFSAFVLRAGGSDSVSGGTFFRDPYASGLLVGRNLDVQGFRPAIVYVNGAYFGIHNIREKMNEDYLAAHHGVEPENVDIVSRYWRRTYPVVSEGDAEAYLELETFLETRDVHEPEFYEELRERVDLDSFLDYTAAQIWFANYDWPGNNNKMWRRREPNSPWRALLYDLDYTLAFDPRQNAAIHDTLTHATQPNGIGWPNPPWTTLLIRRLLEAPEVRTRFINRIGDLMNAELLPANTLPRLDAMTALYEPEMPRHIARWLGTGNVIPSLSAWRDNIESVRTFLTRRSTHVRSHVRAYFGLAGTRRVEVHVDPPNGGRIKVNSLLLDTFPWSGIYFQSVPVSVDVLPAPGFHFVGWQGVPASVDASDARLILDPQEDLTLVARFDPSPGAVNAIVIHEINYHAPEVGDPGDWIELFNACAVPVDLSGWVLKDSEESHAFVIPEKTILGAGGFLVLCAALDSFSARFPHVPNAIGDLGFNLGNGGDQVRLFNARKELMDEVTYQDSSPWPTSADGGGRTLELGKPGDDNSMASSWRASGWVGGSPGAANGSHSTDPTAASLNAELLESRLTLKVQTAPARTYRIEASTNLVEWEDWRLVVGNGEETSHHVLTEHGRVRFFRVVALQAGFIHR